MATRGDSVGFVSTPLEENGACHKDSYYPMSDENASEFNDTDAEFKRLKADFLRIARNRRRSNISRNESFRSPSPLQQRTQRNQLIFPSLKSLHSTQPT